jgi:hypothetical protein
VLQKLFSSVEGRQGLNRVPLFVHGAVQILARLSTLTHHFFDISIGKPVATLPTNTQKDERRLEVSPLERGFKLLHDYDSWRVMDEPKWGL